MSPQEASHPKPDIHYVTIRTNQYEKSRRFYQDLFGWKPLEKISERLTYFSSSTFTLALFEAQSFDHFTGLSSQSAASPSHESFMLSHHVPTKNDVLQISANTVKCGGTVLKQPHTTDWQAFITVIRSPEGTLWEVVFKA